MNLLTKKNHDQAKKDVSHVFALQAMNHFSSATISKSLIRDDFRCTASGVYDSRSVLKNRELTGEVKNPGSRIGNIQCAHIFPQSTNMDISGSNEDNAEVRTHILLHLGHRQLLAPSLTIPRLYGLLSQVSVTKTLPRN